MKFVRNAWYVAGWSSEFGAELKRSTILGDNVVIYRTSAGQVAALEDRCPHRLLPLSMGRVVDGGDVQCGYHGLTFDVSGKCVRAPGQDNVPACSVHAYPVHEKNSIVWIWMGEPAKADPDLIFDLPEFSDPQWHAHQGDALHLKSHYLNVAENLVDPAHVSFVHPTTLGNASSEDVPVHADVDGDVIVAWRWIRNAPPVGFFQKFGGFSGNVDRWHYYYLHMPSIAVIDFGSADAGLNLPEERRNEGVRVFALHFLTPVDETNTIDRWMHLRNIATEDETVSQSMDAMFRIAFNEDKEILEAIQLEENKVPLHRPVRLAIDKGPNVYRARIQRMLEAEEQARGAA
jgi:phenylpropionate dioxygenase-like ring-hydroxylating dioxygenase large terminal subunit